MEEHRLKPMGAYDSNLFNELFKATEALRKKLASEVNCKRFGLEYSDMLSWFNIKFIFVFNKYVNEMPKERLKGFIINALRTYKNKILRYSYQNKFLNNPIELIETYELYENMQDSDYTQKQSDMLEVTYKYMKMQLSNDAFQVFDIELSPPVYILERMKDREKLTKIPPQLIAEYLGYGNSAAAVKYISNLRQEIKGAIKEANITLPQYV
jgi:hypothetical protein